MKLLLHKLGRIGLDHDKNSLLHFDSHSCDAATGSPIYSTIRSVRPGC